MVSRVMVLSGLRLAVWFALVVLLPRGHTQHWGIEICGQKYDECSELYHHSQDCTSFNRTIYCLGNFTDHCVNNVLSATTMRNITIKSKYCPNSNCTTEVQAVCEASFFPPPTTGQPTVQNCTYVPPLPQLDPDNPPLTPLGSPSLVPPPSPTECTLPKYQTNYRQHCSTFSLSHIRPFGDRSLPLQTCLLIGNIYLLKHESLSVSIKGNYQMGNSAFYTYISEVHITLHWHNCFQQTVTYTATTAALSESIPGLAASDSSLLSLTVENQTVATLLAPWINTSIIIHRIDGYLSVTIQVPEPLAREDDVTGLCSDGCVAALQVSDDLPEYKKMCLQNYISASKMCLALGIPTPRSDGQLYSQLCSYDIALTHDSTLLSLYQALGEDANRLPDITQIPTVTIPPDTPTSVNTPKPLATAIFNTETLVSSAPSVSPLLLYLLVCSLTGSLLAVR